MSLNMSLFFFNGDRGRGLYAVLYGTFTATHAGTYLYTQVHVQQNYHKINNYLPMRFMHGSSTDTHIHMAVNMYIYGVQIWVYILH